MNLVSSHHGEFAETDSVKMCFYNSSMDREGLKNLYPEFELCHVHQVHSSHCVQANIDSESKADALWTDRKDYLLFIKTADCAPILVAGKDRILAIHAGWKGVLKNIFKESINEAFNGKTDGLSILVGPFIQKHSFEVGKEVANQFIQEFSRWESHQFIFPHDDSDKRYIDLSFLIEKQVEEMSGTPDHVIISKTDTLTNTQWNSYRRNSQSNARNLSTIFFKSSS